MFKFLKNKEAKNAGWLIGGRVAQMVISLFVGVFTARFLGPGNSGLVDYGSAYVAFFTSLCNLGINSVIIKEFVDHPDEEGETIGTALLLRLISSILSVIVIIAIVAIVDYQETTTLVVVALCSVSLIFHIMETIRYWFQYRYLSKVTAIVTFAAYITTAAYKIILLVLQKDVQWFAFASSVDFIAVAVLLWIAYKKHNGPRLSFSMQKARSLLGKSYHYILSGIMVAVYGQTDKLMLKQMLSAEAVGYYGRATAVCAMWVFVLHAIIDAMYPTILRLYDTNKQAFEKKNKQLYAIVFYVAVFVSLGFTVFGKLIIQILYGEKFLPAVNPLRIVTWYTAFSYLGVARNAWLVCENKQKYLKYMYLFAAGGNVALNFALIPSLGASGAALASLLTELMACLVLPLFIKEVRPNVIMMLQAFALKGVFSKANKEN